jgi:TP901 family phage tail tape measure protein
MAGTEHARVTIGADSSPLRRDLPKAKNQLVRWAGGVKREVGAALRDAFSTLSSVAGFGGVASLVVAGKKVYDFEKKLTRLRINADMSAKDMASLRGQIDDVAVSTGVGQDELLGAASAFVTMTGDIDTARGSLAAWGKISAATGADIDDVAKGAAALSQNLGVGAKDMEKAFNVMFVQGKEGAVELKDMAAVAAGLAPQFATFGKVGVEGLAEMGGLLQIVKRGFNDVGEASTGMESLMTAFAKNSKQIRAATGVSTYEKDGRTLRSMADIVFDLTDAMEKKKLPTGKVIKALGRAEAYRALLPLMKAGRGELEKFAAMGKTDAIGQGFGIWKESVASKVEVATAKIRKAFSETLIKHADSLAKAITKVGEAVQFLAEHPEGVLAVLALLKGGSFLGRAGGGLGDALGGVAGMAGGLGGGGASAGAGGLRGAFGAWSSTRFTGATPGNMLTGAGVGLALAGTIGKDLGSTGQAAMVAAHALAGLPGPLGLVAKGGALAGDALVVLFDHLEKEIDASQKRIVEGQFGKFGAQEARGALTGDASSQRALIRMAAQSGAITAEGGLDTRKLTQQLDKEELAGGEKVAILRALMSSVKTTEGAAYAKTWGQKTAQEAETAKNIAAIEQGDQATQSKAALEQKAEELRAKAAAQKVDVTIRVEDGRLVVQQGRRERQ